MNAKRTAFTLVEILIVVVIMAVLAATIIPQFTASTKDAQESTAIFNLQALRSQIELYKAQHGGSPPAALINLTFRSNASGGTGTAGDSPATYPFGPYMLRLPENPINSQSGVDVANANPPTAEGAATAGWLYHAATGNLYLNDDAFFAE